MYPKQSSLTSRSSSSSQNKRENVARLLISRFRNKYNVNFNSDQILDQKIVSTITSLITSEETLNEKQLVVVSRKLDKIVDEHRKRKENTNNALSSSTKSQQLLQNIADYELKSDRQSNKHRGHQQSMPTVLTVNQSDDIPKIINAMTLNKGLGMTEAEWDKIVRNNAEKEKEEADLEKQKLSRQREQLRIELDVQMRKRKETELRNRNSEREMWKTQLNLMEQQKLLEDTRQATLRATFIKQGANKMREQIMTQQQSREAKALNEKLFELKERQRLEDVVKQTEAEEREKKLMMKLKLHQQNEIDRKIKLDFYNKQQDQRGGDPQNSTFLAHKFFERQQHESYKLRAKNDALTNYIVEKFSLANPKLQNKDQEAFDIMKKRNEIAEEQQRERLEGRKKKELEVARALDIQVLKHKTDQENAKKEVLEIRASQAKEMEQFTQEQEKSKQERLLKLTKHKIELEKLIEQRQKINQYIVSSSAFIKKDD